MAQQTGVEAAREAFITALMCEEKYQVKMSRKAADTFVDSIPHVANICTRSTVEACKDNMVAAALPLPSRTAAFQDYLYALSKSFCPRDLNAKVDTTKLGDENIGLGKIVKGKVQQPPEPAFKRLHLLYLMHRLLVHVQDERVEHESHWTKRVSLEYAPLHDQLHPTATTLARLAVCGCTGKATKTRDTVLHVLSIWKARGIFSPTECEEIEQLVKDASGMGWDEMLEVLDSEKAKMKEKGDFSGGHDWVIPERHSNVDNPNAPWHELPATNALMMKHTRGYPMRAVAFPNGGYECFAAGDRANAEDRRDLQRLYKNMTRANAKYTDPDEVHDIDAMGNIVWKDADLPTRNHWGLTLGSTSPFKWEPADYLPAPSGYVDFPQLRPAGVNSAVERARALAAERGSGGMGRGRDFGYGMGGGDGGAERDHVFDINRDRDFGYGMGGGDGGAANGHGFDMARGGFRGNDRGGYRGRNRGDQRAGFRGRGRW